MIAATTRCSKCLRPEHHNRMRQFPDPIAIGAVGVCKKCWEELIDQIVALEEKRKLSRRK